METKKYKKYDRSFKLEAVTLSYETTTIKECAQKLDIPLPILSRWRKEYDRFEEGSFQGSGYDRVNPKEAVIFELQKISNESELRYEILKCAALILSQGKLKIYQFIKSSRKKYSVLRMCKVLDISYGTYHRWEKNKISAKQQKIALLKEDIKSIFFHFRKHYGTNKITKELHKLGYKICMKQVSIYMGRLGLRYIKKRKYKFTTDSKHNCCISPNILNQNFKVTAHSKVWASDITYLQTTKNFLYLTVVIDLYDRKIIGWNLDSNLSSEKTSIPALTMAVKNRHASEGLIFHSDRGVQYANNSFTEKLESLNCIKSMSRKGCSYDNAICESFFSTLKRELLYRKKKLLSQKEMRTEIFNFIENWYNKKRIHSSLNFKTIEQFNSECSAYNPTA